MIHQDLVARQTRLMGNDVFMEHWLIESEEFYRDIMQLVQIPWDVSRIASFYEGKTTIRQLESLTLVESY